MSILQDLRLAFRLLRRDLAGTGIALLSIALSVAATAVVFAAIKAVLIDPLPYARAEELVQLRSEFPKMQEQSHADWVVWNDTQELIRRTRTLESVGVSGNAIFDLAGDAGATPEALYGLRMTASLFSTLGVSPMLGRNILPEEGRPGHPDVMILSYGLWVRRFNSDRSVVGRTVIVNGHGCLVVGVMPPGFNYPLHMQAAHTPSPYFEFGARLFFGCPSISTPPCTLWRGFAQACQSSRRGRTSPRSATR
jgi:putative ABC transport system permease protein